LDEITNDSRRFRRLTGAVPLGYKPGKAGSPAKGRPMPLRITIDAGCLSHPERTGIGRCLEAVLPRLAELAGAGSELILLAGKPLLSEIALELVRAGKVGARTVNFPSLYAWQQTGLAAQVRALRPDAHYCSDGLAPPFAGAPTVCLVHDLLWERHPETLSWHVRAAYALRARASLAGAAVALTGSRFTKTEAVRVFGEAAGKLEVGRCQGVDTALFRPATDAERAGRDPFLDKYGLAPGYLLCLGNLMAHKNLGLVLDALALARARGATPPVLVVAGLGEAGELARRLPPDYPRERLRCLGYLPDADARAAFRHALALAYPSRYEGFGLPILEAMASGAPVIYAASSALPETAGDAGLAVSPDSPEEMAQAVKRLQDDAGLRQDLIAKGLGRAKLFSWDDCALELRRALTRAAGREAS
jgi:glycosyltransferase involved in cell wall biosynthesis